MIPFAAHELQIPLRHFVSPGDTVYDVGAHQGWLTSPISKLVGSKGKVVAFEPSPTNLAHLVQARQSEGLSNVEVISAAVYRTTGEVITFYDNSIGHISSIYNNSGFIRSAQSVTTLALDDFVEIDQKGPSIVKIDVEGAEYDVVCGAEKLIQRCRPILILETQRDDHRPFQILRDYGYRAYNVLTYKEVVDKSEIAQGRPVDDLIFFPGGGNCGPFGRAGSDPIYEDVEARGVDFEIDIPVQAGINCVRVWGRSDDRYSVLIAQARVDGRIVVNMADQLTLMFNPFISCVIYSPKETNAKFHFRREQGEFAIDKFSVCVVPMTESEHRRHMVLGITMPFGFVG